MPVPNPVQCSYTWIGLDTSEGASAIAEPELPATFTFADAKDRGLSRRGLQRLQAAGAVERIGRGLYRRTDEEPADHDLIEIAAKAHRPTLCMLSALARHELTDVIPPVHDIAIPRGAWQPAVSAPVQWHKFASATFDVGRTEIRLDDTYAIGLYDTPRTIIDTFRLRHAVGPDIANEALRRWLRYGGKPADLMRLAGIFPAAKPALLHTLQVLQ
jgi:predicted transcriptional regulator of viral defense system